MTTEDFPEHVAELALLAEKFEEHRPKLLAMLNNRMDPALRVRLDPDDILNEAFLRAKDRWHDCVQSGLPTYVWLRRLVMDCLKDKWDFHNIRRWLRYEPSCGHAAIRVGRLSSWLL